eukprot:5810052-Prymnesium_polylepis.2
MTTVAKALACSRFSPRLSDSVFSTASRVSLQTESRTPDSVSFILFATPDHASASRRGMAEGGLVLPLQGRLFMGAGCGWQGR